MKQQIESINNVTEKYFRTYELPSKWPALLFGSHSHPDLMLESKHAIAPAQCNLTALINFMQRTLFGVEQMRDARKRKCTGGDVMHAFAAYCKAIEKVEYDYNNMNSLFDVNPYLSKPNCRGRAKGFLQLLAVCGVPLEHLAFVSLGDVEEKKDVKVARRDKATVDYHNVWKPREAPAASNSPNAVTVSLQNNVLNVSRTTREPFANHYCAMVTGRGKYKFWDPLFHHAYVNGMKDYFLTYRVCPELTPNPNGPKCYVDEENEKNRLYAFKRAHVSETFANSNAVREVQAEMADMATDPSVFLIIDSSKDWRNRGDGRNPHPWIVTQVFRQGLVS